MSTDDDGKSEKEDAKVSAREADAAADEASSHDEDESEEDTSEDEASTKSEAPRSKPSGKSSKRARREERRAAEARAAAASVPSSRALMYALAALAAGAAGGWFGHIQQAKAKLRADTATPAASGSAAAAAGPCGAWEKQICAGNGDQSAACQQAKGATGLLTPSVCEVALEALPATLAKVKAERAPCESLVSKLCKDLPPGSQACTLVTERTQMFPAERCKEFLQNYESVLAEVKMIDQQGGMPGGGQQPGMPQGMPPGMPQPGMPPQP
jgi:hypothetical protein